MSKPDPLPEKGIIDHQSSVERVIKLEIENELRNMVEDCPNCGSEMEITAQFFKPDPGETEDDYDVWIDDMEAFREYLDEQGASQEALERVDRDIRGKEIETFPVGIKKL